jgi:hypothetical protein
LHVRGETASLEQMIIGASHVSIATGAILMVIGAIGLVLGLVLPGSRRRAAPSIDDQYR